MVAADNRQTPLPGEGVRRRCAPRSLARPERHDFRAVHYLGSKLRLLRPIRAAIEEVAVPGRGICDLFAGSGAVSRHLASDWNITAADIQEYSRVLCNGSLNAPANPSGLGADLQRTVAGSPLRARLRGALDRLIEHEQECLRQAQSGDIAGLCSLMEHGSLLGLEANGAIPDPALADALHDAWKRLDAESLAAGSDTAVTRYFGGVYFSWRQAAEFDALLAAVHAIDDDGVRDYFLSAALATASDVVNTIGKQFAQPIKPYGADGRPKRHLINQTVRDRSMGVMERFSARASQYETLPRHRRRHRVICGDYRAILADSALAFDAVYADPPYTRDHYSRYYHVLETMARHDEPEVSTTKIRSRGRPRLSRGHYRADRHQSPFCIKSQARRAFEELFRGVAGRGIPLVLSYSPYQRETGGRPRLIAVDDLTLLARQHFSRVDCRSIAGIAHNKLNAAVRNVQVEHPAEILLVCTP